MGLFDKETSTTGYQEMILKLKGDIENLRSDHAKEMRKLEDEAREIKWKLSTLQKESELATEKKLHELRKSMQESLIKSDLLRTEALAKLEIYEKTDTKSDANAIKDMIGKLIEQIGKQSVNVVK